MSAPRNAQENAPEREDLIEKDDWVKNDAAYRVVAHSQNFDIDGSDNDNDIWLYRLSQGENWEWENIDMDIDGGEGDDALIYYDAKSITVTADDGDYDLFLDGGQGAGKGYMGLRGLEVHARNIEEYYLSDRGDRIDLSGATGQIDTMINGAGGDDTFTGSDYDDNFEGGAGNDTIDGGFGDDTIRGGDNDDRLIGSFGADTFVFDDSDGTDTVVDFTTADTIVLEDASVNDVNIIQANGGTTIEFGDTSIFLNGVSSDMEFDTLAVGSDVEVTMDTSSSSSDTVICTYMFERGYIPADVYQWDGIYGQRLGAEVLAGYHAWAIPLVEHVLKRSEIATQIVRPMACAWAQEMAHRYDPENHPKGSRLGAAILTVGVPLCRTIARVTGVAARAVSA